MSEQTLAAQRDDELPVGEIVEIHVNGDPIAIRAGRRPVSAIKRLGGVPLADVLAQRAGESLIDLPDDGFVEIRGGEEFFSHPRDSASSTR